jgi:exodeoxyribonuclease V alpha subunit
MSAPGNRVSSSGPAAPAPGGDEVVLEGRVKRILFRDEAALFTALRIRPAHGGRDVTVVGEFFAVAPGDEYRLIGAWVVHPRWGEQFQVARAERKLPRQKEAIVAYLGGGLFSGIGQALARRLVEHFGPHTLDAILNSPERVEEVPGISAKKRRRLVSSLREHRHIQDLALFLQGHGVSLYLTKKIHAHYAGRALEVVRTDPYRVAADVPGIGFLKADGIARRLGLPPDAPARIRASVLYVLRERCEVRGHSFLPRAELVRDCLGFLNKGIEGAGIAAPQVAAAIDGLIAEDHLVREGPEAVYLKVVHQAEVSLARRLRALIERPPPPPDRVHAIVAGTAAEAGLTYAPEQQDAIRGALTSSLVIVTGGPGTGKSTVIRGVISALRQARRNAEVLLAAPTGRAAKRMAEVTGCEARTIHRLLEFSPESGTFARDEADPLRGDMLVVDEASMVDLLLASALFAAIPGGMRVLLVGDADQLPSVGFGNVFADLIQSGRVPVVRLRHVFRQAACSSIVTNAHLVNAGRMPVLERGSDCELVPLPDEAHVAAYVRDAAAAHRAAGLALEQITVLTPMRKTETGVVALNRLLQEALNPAAPGKAQLRSGETVFRTGDKVMQVRNNYHKGVFNGDVGVIAAIRLAGEADDDTEDEDVVVVNFQGSETAYVPEELHQLVLAYACTIHKAQGSEYGGIVLVPMVEQHAIMLQRNLLYTAITRARDRVVLVGQLAAIRRAVANARSRRRYSRLADRLRGPRPGDRPREGNTRD